MRLHALAAIVALSASLCAAPADSIFPLPPPPAPVPAPPAPGGLLDLKTGELYVVNSPADGALLVWPKGLVSVSKRKGPLTLDAVFADAKVPGESETRDYAGPHLWVLKPVPGKSGALAITFIPKTWVDEKEFQHAAITVNHAPQPPLPNPNPNPAPNVTQTGEWVIVVANEAMPSTAQGKILDGPTLRAFKGAGKCRIYTDISEADKLAAKGYDKLIRDANLKTPVLLVLDGQGKTVLIESLPLDEPSLAAATKAAMKP